MNQQTEDAISALMYKKNTCSQHRNTQKITLLYNNIFIWPTYEMVHYLIKNYQRNSQAISTS